MWIEILKKEVETRGLNQVSHELGLSKSTVSLVCSGKYPGGTGKVEERISKVYGNNGQINCPVLGVISPSKCAEIWHRAKRIGMKAGNPETLKLHSSCRMCTVRG